MDWRKGCVLAVGLLTGGTGCVQTSGARPGETAQQPSKKSSANLSLAEGRLLENQSTVPDTPSQMARMLRDQARQSYKQALDQDPKNVEAELAMARLAGADG